MVTPPRRAARRVRRAGAAARAHALRQMQYFVTLAHSASFTQAAQRLSVTQPAVFASGNVNETLLRASAALGLHLEPAYRTACTEPIYALVRHRQALAVMPRLYTMSLRDAELVTLVLSSPRVQRTIAMLGSAGAERSPAVAACRERIARRASASMRDDVAAS